MKNMKIPFRNKEYESLIECYGDNQDIAEVSVETFRARILKGIPVEKALTTPKHKLPYGKIGSHLVEGVEYHNLLAVARAYGMTNYAIYKRHSLGFRGDELVPEKKRKNYVPPEPKPSKNQVEFFGVTYKSLAEALRVFGVDKNTFNNRMRAGYPLEQCLGLEPFADRRITGAKMFEYEGEKLTLKDIKEKLGVYPSTFLARLERGFSVEEALKMKSRKSKKK